MTLDDGGGRGSDAWEQPAAEQVGFRVWDNPIYTSLSTPRCRRQGRWQRYGPCCGGRRRCRHIPCSKKACIHTAVKAFARLSISCRASTTASAATSPALPPSNVLLLLPVPHSPFVLIPWLVTSLVVATTGVMEMSVGGMHLLSPQKAPPRRQQRQQKIQRTRRRPLPQKEAVTANQLYESDGHWHNTFGPLLPPNMTHPKRGPENDVSS